MENILEEMMTVILYFVLENGEWQRLITEYNNKTKHLFFLSHDVEEKTHQNPQALNTDHFICHWFDFYLGESRETVAKKM